MGVAMAMTENDYRHQVDALLPRGPLWKPKKGGVVDAVLYALSREAALNRGDVMTAAREFLDVGLVKKRDAAGNVVYDEAGRTVYVQSKGLVRRRRREAEVFAS